MRKFLVYFSACCVIVAITWHIVPARLSRQPLNTRSLGQKIPEVFQRPRPIYRYSVIPGGAYSSEELTEARRTDPVVRAHYADFRSDGIALRTLPRDSYMYVSYRKSNRVYWTKKKHRIAKRESVLSDGTHLVRARCGNRLSFLPMMPILPGPELPEEAFNAPEPPEALQLPTSPLLTAAYAAPDLPLATIMPKIQEFPVISHAASPISSGPLTAPVLGYFGPMIGPIGIVGTTRPGGGGGGGSGPPGGGGVPLGSVPEPATGLLSGIVSALLAGLYATGKVARSRRI